MASSHESSFEVCVLPPRYDFCVSYPALVAGMDSPEFQEAQKCMGMLWRTAVFWNLFGWTNGSTRVTLETLSIPVSHYDSSGKQKK